MKGVITLLVLFFCVFLASSQITFSRNWVRGRYPGGADLLADDQDNPAFLRSAKDNSNIRDDIVLNSRSPKTPVSAINMRLFQDLLQQWKPKYLSRYKDKELIPPFTFE